MAFVGALHTNLSDHALLKQILGALFNASKFTGGNHDVMQFYTDRLLPMLRAKKVDHLLDLRNAIELRWSGSRGGQSYHATIPTDSPCLLGWFLSFVF